PARPFRRRLSRRGPSRLPRPRRRPRPPRPPRPRRRPLPPGVPARRIGTTTTRAAARETRALSTTTDESGVDRLAGARVDEANGHARAGLGRGEQELVGTVADHVRHVVEGKHRG